MKIKLVTENGLMTTTKDFAENKAKSLNLDLVEVSPGIWKIFDQKRKKFKKQKTKKTKKVKTKEVKLSLKIGQHDLEVKANQVRKFLDKGHNVIISLLLRGREIIYSQEGVEVVEEFLNCLGIEDKVPKLDGKKISVFLSN